MAPPKSAFADLDEQYGESTPIFTPEKPPENKGAFDDLDTKYGDTAVAEGLNPRGIEQVKNAAAEGTGVPSIQRVMSGLEMGPLGPSFNLMKYKAANPNADTWDMIGDVLTSATSVIPGANVGKTIVKTGLAAGAGAGTGALITALGGTEGIAKAVQKYPVLKPLMVGLQAVGAGMALKDPTVKPLSKVGQEAESMGVTAFTPSAEAMQYGDKVLAKKEYNMALKNPAEYSNLMEKRSSQLKGALEETAGSAVGMTADEAGAAIKGNIEAKQKALGDEFGRVEEKIKNTPKQGYDNKDISYSISTPLKKHINKFDSNSFVVKDGNVIDLDTKHHTEFAKSLGWKPSSNDMSINNTSARNFLLKNGYSIGTTYARDVRTGMTLGFSGKKSDANVLAKYLGATKDELKTFEGLSNITDVSSQINDYLKSQKVGDVIKGNEAIKSVDVINLIKERANLVKNATSTEDLLNQKRQFGEEIKKAFMEKGSKDNNAKKAVYRIIDDAIYESIPDKAIANEWKAVNEKWTELSRQLDELQVSEKDSIANTDAYKIFSNKVLSKGPDAVDALKNLAGEQAVKDAGMQYLFYEATKGEGLNTKVIKDKITFLKNKGIADKVFGADLEKIEKFIRVSDFVEAPSKAYGMTNKIGKGAQTAWVQAITSKVKDSRPWYEKAWSIAGNIKDTLESKAFLSGKNRQIVKGVGRDIGGAIMAGVGKGTKGSLKSLEDRKEKK